MIKPQRSLVHATVWTLRGFQAVLLVVPALSIYLLTVSHDEAWLVLSIRNMVDHGVYASGAFLGPLTTGGVYSLVQVVIAYLLPDQIWFPRLFSYLCWLLLYWEVVKYTRVAFADVGARVLARTAFFAVPGAMTLTAQAFGFLPALLLSVYGLRMWNHHARSRLAWRLLAALLFGLAIATRVNFIVLLPALVVWAWVADRSWSTVRRSLFVAGVAVVVFLGSAGLLSLFTPDSGQLLTETVTDSGLSSFATDYVRLSRRWEILNGHLFLPVAVAITGFGFAMRTAEAPRLHDWRVLLIASWFMLFAWLIFAPIPHLRYIWPALFVFFMIGGLALAEGYLWGVSRERTWVVCTAFVVAASLLVSGGVFALKQLAHGNTDLLSFEWSRESELLRFRRFQHVQDQRDFAQYMRSNIPEEEVVAVLYSSVTVSYLTGLECVGPMEWKAGLVDRDRLPEYFVIDPLVGSYLYPRGDAMKNFLEHAEVLYRRGDYTLLRVGSDRTDYGEIFMSLSRGYPPVPPRAPNNG